MEYNEELVRQMMQAIRVKNPKAEQEVADLVDACKRDLEIAGVYVDDNDSLCRQAIKLYCKANYGYDKDSEKFREAYASMRDSMALSGDYKKGGSSDGGGSEAFGINKQKG